jgi:carbamoyl-phosphate synthase large subunit
MRVLITAIGGDIAQSIAKILKRNIPDIYLIGSDITIENAGKYFVDKIIQVVPAEEAIYLQQMEKIYCDEKLDLIIPVNEKEIMVFLTTFFRYYNKVVLPKTKYIKLLFDKLEAYSVLKSLNMDLPWTVRGDSTPVEYPCILKLRKSSGSKSLKVLHNINEYNFLEINKTDYIIQELLEPKEEEYTCGVYRNIVNTYIIIMKRELKGGLTGFAKVVKDNEISEYCYNMANCLDVYGSINIQLIKTKNGPKLLEINPRFSSTVIFRDYIGFQDLIWCINDNLGEKNIITYNDELNIGKKFYRIYDERYE